MQHGLGHGTLTMFFIMIVSGLLSAMYIWADQLSDVRLSLNDFYMSFLMASWMLVGMGLVERSLSLMGVGTALVVVSLYFIRNQLFVGQGQYIQGMIPHHSMAIFMSKKLLEKGGKQAGSRLNRLAKDIIRTQRDEINLMKSFKA